MTTKKRRHQANERGREGEEAARSYLIERGYVIIEINHRSRHGEVDIIARDGDTLVFVEVKTRSSLVFGSPAEAVGQEKQSRLQGAALAYLLDQESLDIPARFDVVSLLYHQRTKTYSIELIQNAFSGGV